jgi:hypothetical protein
LANGGVVKPRQTEQVIGREAETATLLFSLSFELEVRGCGFRPRQRRRCAASLF